ncbi:1541_t:CDS:2 [Entrophospora sp. SA101]|nr:11019_t:CDS:2 [Entrophospora sp. SA101]CAJ0894598.1 1541_t:CDS:2 [Entrophospora sp. SA101]CAJ0923898.1 19340_t:CDS:2 [Entrophospora sp. SA101]
MSAPLVNIHHRIDALSKNIDYVSFPLFARWTKRRQNPATDQLFSLDKFCPITKKALAASTTTPQTKIRSVLNNKDDRNKRKRDYLLQKRQCLGGAPCNECCTAAVLPPPISPCGGRCPTAIPPLLPCGGGPCGGTCGSGSCKTPTVYSSNCGSHNEYQGSYDNCNQLQSCDETQQQVCYDNCQESQYNLMM